MAGQIEERVVVTDEQELMDSLDGEAQESQEEIEQSDEAQSISRIELRTETHNILDLAKAVLPLCEETKLRINKDGIQVMQMDQSGISMVKAFLPNRAFSKFSITQDTDISLDLKSTNKLLSKIFGKSAEVTIKEFGTKVDFINGNKKLSIKSPEYVKNAEKEPIIDYKVNIEIDGNELLNILKSAEDVSDYINIRAVNGEGLFFVATSEGGEINESCGLDRLSKFYVNGKEQSASFRIDELLKFFKSIGKDTKVEVKMATNEPIRVSYQIDQLNLVYHLAPYME